MNNNRHGRHLVPRDGHTLVVGVVARISGCANQKELSLEDQIDHARQVVGDLYDGPVEYRPIATKGNRVIKPLELDFVAATRKWVAARVDVMRDPWTGIGCDAPP